MDRLDRPLALVELGPAAPINQAVDAWRRTWKARRQPDTGEGDPAHVLRKKLWEPVGAAAP